MHIKLDDMPIFQNSEKIRRVGSYAEEMYCRLNIKEKKWFISLNKRIQLNGERYYQNLKPLLEPNFCCIIAPTFCLECICTKFYSSEALIIEHRETVHIHRQTYIDSCSIINSFINEQAKITPWTCKNIWGAKSVQEW